MQLVPVPPHIAFAQAQWEAMPRRARAAWITAAMAAADRNKSDLADRLGVSFQTVHAWAAGDKIADWSRRMSITLALELPELWDPTPEQLGAAVREVEQLREQGSLEDEKPRPKKKAR